LMSARQGRGLLPGWILVEEREGWTERLDAGLRRRKNVYLSGYWQDHRFFGAWGSELGRRLEKSVAARKAAWNGYARLSGEDVLSVHVRGLPGSSASGRRISGLAPAGPAFYEQALETVQARTRVKRALVFSDGGETGFVEKMITARAIESVSVGGLAACEDLYLMSRCGAHICAQSTFSWWGAWLAGEANHVVIWPGSGGQAPEPAIPAWWQVLPDGVKR